LSIITLHIQGYYRYYSHSGIYCYSRTTTGGTREVSQTVILTIIIRREKNPSFSEGSLIYQLQSKRSLTT